MKLMNLEFTRIGHDTFRIQGSKVIYTDPFRVAKADQADIVLLSHEHFDHLSLEDLKKVTSTGTTLVASVGCEVELDKAKVTAKETKFLEPGGKLNIGEVEIEAVPAYNLNKFRAPGQVFHPRQDKKLGFVFKMDGTRVYFAGDTDFIPEMKSLRCDIALLPVSGTYVMTVEEAVEAAEAIKPQIAVPMHYAAIVGSDGDAQKFKSQVKSCRVEII
jgi:L-ascorbate metabolism protein UlaG (beta-lactamase superfamily)